MTFNLRTMCVLALAIGVCVNGYAQSEEAALASPLEGALLQEVAPIQDSFVSPVSCNSCDTGSCNSCDSGGCDLGMGDVCSQNGQFFVGAEYLSVRANFSEATAYLEEDLIEGTSTWKQYDFNYSESFRTYIGYRLCDCGGEVRFTYTNIDTGGGFDAGDLSSTTRLVTAPWELALTDPTSLTGTANVSIDNYDLGFSKTIPLGSPLCCDTGCGDTCCGDGCGDCCGTDCCTQCPAWDLQWTGAVRVADVNSRLGYQLQNGVDADEVAESVVDFQGFGLRTGLLGRRYLGKNGIASVYLSGDISLLLGEVDHYAEGATTTSRNQISSTQVVPVTEMEAGATVFVLPNVSLSGGYMLSVWHDLGHRATYEFDTSGAEALSMDDANLMTLDGWFLRAEAAF